MTNHAINAIKVWKFDEDWNL